MTHIKSISIPEPCHQSWQQMTEANNGRHCAHCCKTVVDFTLMSNDEIIAHLSNSSHVCGRFGQQQLGNLNYDLYKNSLPKASWWKRAAVIIGIAGPFLSHKANAQAKPTIINTGDTYGNGDRSSVTLGKVVPNRLITVTGKVLAKEDKLPIPGAMIKVKGTNSGTVTNVDGKFTINVQPGSTLVVSFIGYETQQVPIANNANKPLDIVMQMNATMTGEVVLVGAVTTRPKCQKAWRRVKGLLGVHSELAADSNNMRSRDF